MGGTTGALGYSFAKVLVMITLLVSYMGIQGHIVILEYEIEKHMLNEMKAGVM